jgi:hypothetical protein
VITVVFRSAFIRPHGGLLSNQTAFLESQPIHTIQEVLRRTLRTAGARRDLACVMDALQRAVPVPLNEAMMKCKSIGNELRS